MVSPASFRHFGLAYGHGIVGNIRARPWRALLVPAFLWSFRRAAAVRDCDLVHAHWLAAGAVAATLRKPFLVQVWGTDVELARRVAWQICVNQAVTTAVEQVNRPMVTAVHNRSVNRSDSG